MKTAQKRGGMQQPDSSKKAPGQFLGYVYDLFVAAATLNQISKYRQKAVDALELQEGQSVLDFACGTGGLSIIAAGKVGEEGKVIGIDLSKAMLARAARKSRGITQLDYIRHDFGTLPVITPYDAAMVGLAAHEVPAKTRLSLYRKAYDSLRAGGRLLVFDYAIPKKGIGGKLFGLFLRLAEPHSASYLAEDHLGLLTELGFSRIYDKVEGVFDTAVYQKPE